MEMKVAFDGMPRCCSAGVLSLGTKKCDAFSTYGRTGNFKEDPEKMELSKHRSVLVCFQDDEEHKQFYTALKKNPKIKWEFESEIIKQKDGSRTFYALITRNLEK